MRGVVLRMVIAAVSLPAALGAQTRVGGMGPDGQKGKPGRLQRDAFKIANNCTVDTLYYVTRNGSTYYAETTCVTAPQQGSRQILPWEQEILRYAADNG